MTMQEFFCFILGLFLIWLGTSLLVVGLLLRPVGEPTPYIVATGVILILIGWRLYR